jgi:cytochrome oxidase assembly protein ShyY1
VPWLLAPRWLLLHVGTVVAVVAMVLLGQWQMRSYAAQELREQEAAAAAALEADPVPVSEAVPPGQPLLEDSQGVLATATGTYDPDATLLLPGRTLDGATGWYVVTPLLDDAGVATPVLRGWVASDDAAAVEPPTGTVTVTGVVTAPESADDAAVPASTALPEGQVAALTTTVLFTGFPYPPGDIRQAVVVAVDESRTPATAPDRVPVAQAAPAAGGVSAWRHLSYAWQWWLFAAAAIAFWVAFVRAGVRERRDERAAAALDVAEPTRSAGP